MDSQSLQAQMRGLWTTQDLTKRFGVTAMTIRQWRLELKLPAVVLEGKGRPAIRFVPIEVKKWARLNNKCMVN